MTGADAELRNAIELSYAAFASVPRPQSLDASPLRDADGILATLTAVPLRELSGEQVGPYSGWAVTTVGDGRDYGHFLPRIFELSVTDPVWLGTEPPVMASRLNMAGWRNWPEQQRSAVLRFFRSAFAYSIERHPDEDRSADNWFCGLTILGDSASLIFERWLSSTSQCAALQLASLVIAEAKHIRRHEEVKGPFWEEVDAETRRDVARRLASPETAEFLRTAANSASDEDRFFFLDAAMSELQRQD